MKIFKIVLLAALFISAPGFAQPILPKTGEKIAFLGDSITAGGWSSVSGYVRLVLNGLELQNIKVEPIPAGVSGHDSRDMLAHLQKAVLDKKPNWMTLSCGVNDVWHGEKGVSLEDYKKNITEIVDKAQAAGIKVMILTSTMIGEDQANSNNQKLIAYNDFLRSLAKEKKLVLADLNAEMQTAVQQGLAAPHPPGNLLTGDGVHMNVLGSQMMAAGVLKAFGLTKAQIEAARKGWMEIPGAARVGGKGFLTASQLIQLRALAVAQNKTVEDLTDDTLSKALQSLLEATPPNLPAKAQNTAVLPVSKLENDS